MGNLSIWTTAGRQQRLGITTTTHNLERLRNKRRKQLTRLIEKYKKTNPKKANRYLARRSNHA